MMANSALLTVVENKINEKFGGAKEKW